MLECVHCGSEEVEVFVDGVFHCLTCGDFFEDEDEPTRKFVMDFDERV